MDLLNMLSGLLTDSSSISALSQKAGTDSKQTKGILDAALPMLLGALKNNASSEEGASSLLGALQQHTNTASIKDQIDQADAEDGSKIIQHILGKDQSNVLQSIADKTGAKTDQISSLLSNMAPGMMSSLSAVTQAAGAQKVASKKPVATKKPAASPKIAATAKIEATHKPAASAKVTVSSKPKAEEIEEQEEKAAPAQAAGLDLSGILGGLLGGGNDDKSESSGGLGGLLGGLLGGTSNDDGKTSENPLLGALGSLLKR